MAFAKTLVDNIVEVTGSNGNVYTHNSFGETYVINPSKNIDLESRNGVIRLETSKASVDQVLGHDMQYLM